MKNSSYVSYICKGDKTINFSLPIKTKNDIQVYINNILMDSSYYHINDIGLDNQNISFIEDIGSISSPITVTILLVPNIKRKTFLQNDSHISAKNLNLELDNIVNNVNIVYELSQRDITSDKNDKSKISLPNAEANKILYWDQKGNIVNSEISLNVIIDDINELKKIARSFRTGFIEKETQVTTNDDKQTNKIHTTNSNSLDTIPCNQIIYQNGTIPNVISVFDALEFLNNYINQINTKQNNLLNSLSSLSETENKLLSKITLLEESIKNNQNLKNEEVFTNNNYGIVSSKVNVQGYTDFLSNTKNPYEICLQASIKDPFIVNFTKQGKSLRKVINKDIFLKVKNINSLQYIYIDLNDDNTITLGCTDYKPFYIHYLPNQNSSVLLLDKYKFQGDYFHIPSLTMYTSKNQAINRLYIGQIIFSANGLSLEYCNNFALGNSIFFDVNVANQIDRVISFSNPFGLENILHNIYLKSNIVPATYENINYVPLNIIYREDGLGNVLNYGINAFISNQYIKCTMGKRFIQAISRNDAQFTRSTKEVILRIIINRGF